jgi:hypothetical protein
MAQIFDHLERGTLNLERARFTIYGFSIASTGSVFEAFTAG